MIYVVYEPETGICEDIAFSQLNMIQEGKSYVEVTEEDWSAAQGKDKKVIDGKFTYKDFPPSVEDYDKAMEELSLLNIITMDNSFIQIHFQQ